MSLYSNNEIQKIIFNAYSNPKYKVDKINENKYIYEHSNVCVDDLKLFLKWKNEILIEAKYEAIGCAVFLASCDLAISLFINKTKQEIKKLLNLYSSMINGNNLLNDELEKLDTLAAFRNVKIHLNRLECASIIYRAFKKDIND